MNACARRVPLIAMLSALALGSVAAQAVELRGFRGVAWGSSVDGLGPASLAYQQGEVRCYRRERENMLYGDSPVKDIRYCFHHDHLFLVALEADVGVDELVHEFQSTYGAPDVSVPAKVTWGDHATRARVEMSTTAQGGASMLMYSNEYEPHAKREARAH